DEGMLDKAYETATKGLELDEFNKELYYFAAVVAHKRHLHDESEHFVKKAIDLDPDYKEAILFLVERLKAHENHAGIVTILNESKQTSGCDGLYEWELARAYNELEEYEDALKHYKEAYDTLYDDSDFLKEFGYFLTEEGNIEEAIRIFKSYMENQPDDTVIEEFLIRLNDTEH